MKIWLEHKFETKMLQYLLDEWSNIYVITKKKNNSFAKARPSFWGQIENLLVGEKKEIQKWTLASSAMTQKLIKPFNNTIPKLKRCLCK